MSVHLSLETGVAGEPAPALGARPAPPSPERVTGLAGLAEELGALRAWAGSPSYGQLAVRVARLRRSRGNGWQARLPGRTTVYDCFRPQRRRVDVDLVVDLAAVLGAPPQHLDAWRAAAVAAMAPARAVPVAAAVPPAPRRLVGRSGETATVLTRLSRPGVVVIEGLAGSGKSALAFTVAEQLLRRHVARHPQYLDLRGRQGPTAAVDLHEALASLRPQREDWLLLLDDAAGPEQVLALLPRLSRGRVLITSRWSFEPAGADVERVVLGGLAPADSMRLVGGYLGAGSEPVEPDQAALRELCELAGHLPSGLHLVGAQLRDRPDWSLADHVHQLSAERVLLRETAADAAIETSYLALPDRARQALRQLAQHPGNQLDRASAAALGGPDVEAQLATLEAAHLVARPAPGHWVLHDLVRDFGRKRSLREDRPAARARALRALLDHYLRTAAAAVAAEQPDAVVDWYWLDPGEQAGPVIDGSVLDAGWLARERRTLVELVGWASVNDLAETTVRLAAVIAWPLWRGGELETALAVTRTAELAAHADGESPQLALARRCLARSYLLVGRRTEAGPLLELALRYYRRRGDTVRELRVRAELSTAADRGDPRGAAAQAATARRATASTAWITSLDSARSALPRPPSAMRSTENSSVPTYPA